VKCSASLSNRAPNLIIRPIDHMKFADFMVFFVYHIPSCSFGSTFIIVYTFVCFIYFCPILQVMYSCCNVCSVPNILSSSCQLAFLGYPD